MTIQITAYCILHTDYLFFFVYAIQIGYEFDFIREANAMEKIRRFLYENNKKTPVLVPRVIRDMVSRYVMLHPIFMWSGLANMD